MFSVLILPGALLAFIPALIGRLAFAMIGLTLLLATHESTGSFAIAGAITAASGIANVVASPWRARAIDRWGQRCILPVLAMGQMGALFAFAVATAILQPAAALLLAVSAIVGVTSPPLGAAMRVVWASLTAPGAQRKAAFSLDATCEELLFVFGPALATMLATGASGSAAIVIAALCAGTGAFGLAMSSASQQVSSDLKPGHRDHRPLHHRGFARVLVSLVGVGLVLGVIEVFTPAYASEIGAVDLSGWLLAAFAVGSALGGVIYGALPLTSPLTMRLAVLIVGLCTTVAVLPFVMTLLATAAGLFVAGLALAPSLITGYLIADETVPPTAQTEASAWINTVVNLGASAGAGLTGVVIDGWSSDVLLWATAAIAFIGVAAVPHTVAKQHEEPPAAHTVADNEA